MSYAWTEERMGQLRDMWLSGATASTIMTALVCTSRAAVCGKLQRMRLLGVREKPQPKAAKLPTRSATSAVPAIVKGRPDQGIVLQQRLARMSEEPIPLNVRKGCFVAGDRPVVSFTELRAQSCRWPLGESPFLFCGETTPAFGCPYCAEHMAIAYTQETADEKRENRKASIERRDAEIERVA